MELNWTGEERRQVQTVRLDRQDMDELVARLGVGEHEHRLHHDWIQAEIERDQERRAFWVELRGHVVKWGAVSVLTIVFFLVWQGLRQYIKSP